MEPFPYIHADKYMSYPCWHENALEAAHDLLAGPGRSAGQAEVLTKGTAADTVYVCEYLSIFFII